jgi:hypothetical protein
MAVQRCFYQKLRLPQGFGSGMTVLEIPVKPFHENGRGKIVHLPEACHHTRRTSKNKTSSQSDYFIAFGYFCHTRFAGTECYQIAIDIQSEDFLRFKPAFVFGIRSEKQRGKEGRFGRVFTVAGEMNKTEIV